MNNLYIYRENRINLNYLQDYLNNHPNDNIIINIGCSKGLRACDIDKLIKLNDSKRLYIRIAGGYDDDRIKNYSADNLVKMHTEDNIYTLNETKLILLEIEDIEAGINKNWDELQKLMYFIGQLKSRIIYHPFYENQPSKEIRSLRGLISGKTVCAGYALILKELCDRNSIKCDYVEGTISKKDCDQGYLTHAWNIVQIGGNNIPVDLTFNASNSRSGKLLSLEDIGNVNEFVKTHYPGRYERLQHYKANLKSIDGNLLRVINGLVNHDVMYKNTSIQRKRRNGTSFILTQVGQIIRNNEYVYKYMYQDVYKGKILKPVILYTTTNVSRIYELEKNKAKLLYKLKEATNKGNKEEIEQIKKQLEGSYLVDSSVDYIDNLMFSVVNINDAIKRGDYFVGAISVQKDQKDRKYIETVYVDTKFGKELYLGHKTYTRNDGSSFVLESSGFKKIDGKIGVYVYRIYEPSSENGKTKVQQYTIFTDKDILTDTRSEIPNIFLDSKRLARKAKESGGYLGYLADDNIKTYNPETNEFFVNGLYQKSKLKSSDFRDYYSEATFKELKKLILVYDLVVINNHEVVMSKHTKKIIMDEDIVLHTKFAYLWLKSAGMKWTKGEIVGGFEHAFNSESEEIFNFISKAITNSMNKDGNIDPIDILYFTERNSKYRHAKDIVIGLFSSQIAVDIINKLYRKQNPSAMREKTPTAYFDGGLYVYEDAYDKLNARKKEILAAREKMLEVIYNQNGEAQIKPIR